MSSLIQAKEKEGQIHGCRVARGAPTISHLFFADDCFIYFRANEQETKVVKQILEEYGIASGQRVNFTKSSISFSRNVDVGKKELICSLLGVGGTSDHGLYLGTPSFVGRNKKKVFEYIKDRVWKKLNGWNTKKLSRAGKEILLKTVAQAVLTFVMSVLLLPLGVCHDIEKVLNSFWWGSKKTGGRGISWLRWDRLCIPKMGGGLGFRKLHDFNLALLGKQGWKFVTNPSSLVSQIYQARYYPNSSFFKANLGSNPSYAWRSIWASRDIVRRYSRIQVGNGSNIQVTTDPWLPDVHSGMISTALGDNYESVTVQQLMIADEKTLDKDLVVDIFNQRDQTLILNIPLSCRSIVDQWYWLHDRNGMYSVKSCYRHQQTQIAESSPRVWSLLWKLPIPPKIRSFMWRALKGVLPTADNLRRRMIQVQSLCPVCVQDRESIHHLLGRCPIARECWLLTPIPIQGRFETVMSWFSRLTLACSQEIVALTVMICWVLWTNRNNKVWRNKSWSAGHILHIAGNMMNQWQEAHHLKGLHSGNPQQPDPYPTTWQKPMVGWYKMNVDAAVDPNRSLTGCGSILRDAEGHFISARAAPVQISLPPNEAEAMSMREALSWLKHMHLPQVIVEMDSQVVYKALKSTS